MKSQVDKKIIGFDMDGVIIDHTARKIALAKSFGFKLNKKETPPEVMKRLIPEPEYRKLQYFLYDHPETALLPSLMPGIKSVLARVKRSGLPYCLISRRQKSKMSQKLLEKHGLWPKYFNEKNTYWVKEISDKEVVAKKVGVTHYIDDDSRVLKALVSVKNKFLFDHLGVFKNSPYRRVKSWKEVSKLI